MLVVFDIDGTLANIDHRLDYVRSKPKNWKAFTAGIPYDKANLPVVRVFHALYNEGHTLIFASGRNESSREVTIAWLSKYGLWFPNYSKLYLRKDNDSRGDDIVKQEILDQIIADYGRKPDMVFDDRPRVVKMWRDNGIFVFDVYQGTKDF